MPTASQVPEWGKRYPEKQIGEMEDMSDKYEKPFPLLALWEKTSSQEYQMEKRWEEAWKQLYRSTNTCQKKKFGVLPHKFVTQEHPELFFFGQ